MICSAVSVWYRSDPENKQVVRPGLPPARRAASFTDRAELVDEGSAVFFPGVFLGHSSEDLH